MTLGFSAFLLKRKQNVEDAPFTGVAFDRDLAAVQVDDLMGDGQPKSGSVRLGREERFKQPQQVLGRNPMSCIRNGDVNLASSFAPGEQSCPDGEFAVVAHRIQRVEE